jgi:hypothetical protein
LISKKKSSIAVIEMSLLLGGGLRENADGFFLKKKS